jgi:hypothetical protein
MSDDIDAPRHGDADEAIEASQSTTVTEVWPAEDTTP